MQTIKSQRQFKRKLLVLTISALALEAQADTYAPWLTQVGITDKVMSAANWGRGLYLGVVDTGVRSSSSVFASGQVSTSLSACAAVSFACSNGFQDDNGHGTAVAEIAAGNAKFAFNSTYGGYRVVAGNVISVAPNANIIAEKVLNAAGSGYSTDVASGVRKAADAGAAVINVSITYGNTPDIVAAINYAAAKGAMIVWAGGNSAQNLLNGANTNGLTAAAIQRLVFVGSVNASNALSGFSNRPGSGRLVVNGATQTAYMNRWLMAPGEAILAPYVLGGNNAWAYWSGTSMSAPMVSGALILLESAWPILRTNGTAANLLLATSTDLGSKGVDASFGNGLMNLTTAFQPFGTLSVTGANGNTYAVNNLTRGLMVGGALGSLSSVQSRLSNYTAFDGFSRNFTVNLTGLVATANGSVSLNPLPSNTNRGPVVVKLNGGSEFAYWQQTQELSPTAHVFGSSEESQFKQGFAMMRLSDGTRLAAGSGYVPQYAHQSALFDSNDMSRLALDMDNADLNSIAQGGLMSSIGLPLGEGNRLAVSWSQSGQVNPLQLVEATQASKMSVGVSHAFDTKWQLGITYSSLQEQQGFLGSVFSQNSMLGLHGNSQSQALELATSYHLHPNHMIMAQMSVSETAGVQANGLLSGANDLHAQGWGIGWLSKQLLNTSDQLTLTIKQPLRVTSGSMDMRLAGVDDLGQAVYHTEKVSLIPDGRELDFKLAYDTPLAGKQNLSVQAMYRQDAFHMRGVNELTVGGMWNTRF